jgi:hypothetical protein
MPPKRKHTPLPGGWWLLPAMFLGLLVWIGVFKLAGVL